jgi:hypothetical protein
VKPTVVAVLLLALCLVLPAGAARRATLDRSLVDRPDDVTGPQVHVVYAIPSDGVDRGLDTDGTIARSIGEGNDWLASETGGLGGFRLDTYHGTPDVTFFRDPHTDAAMAARDPYIRDTLETDLYAAGVIPRGTDKIYAVYYDGSSTYSCGGGAFPPTLPGVVGAMYLHGRPPGAPACDTNTLASPNGPGYLEFGMIHELMHTLGFVPPCAPHFTRAGHVSDATNDLMYAGDQPWSLPPTLDVGHDDYFETGRSDCPDLAKSPFLVGNKPPAPVVKPRPKVKPKPKAKKCTKGQRSTKRRPCRR